MRFWEGLYTAKVFSNTRKKFVNSGIGRGAVLMDLLKASYCLDHELLIAKLRTFSLGSSN